MFVAVQNAKSTDRLTPRDVIAAAMLAILSVLALSDAWTSIVSLSWQHEELSYVLVAPVVIIWLGWERRKELVKCRRVGEWFGLIVLGAGCFLYWYGYRTDAVFWRAGAVLTLLGSFVTVFGWDFVIRYAPALAAFVFLIPVSPNGRYRLAVPLQNATAHATQIACDMMGINVDRAGSLLNINGVDVAVEEACNGMRMVLSLFLVCYVVAFTNPLRPWVRLIFLAASPITAIVCNVVRLVPTVWLFGNASQKTAQTFHDASGWGMLLVAFGGLMALCTLLNRLIPPKEGRR